MNHTLPNVLEILNDLAALGNDPSKKPLLDFHKHFSEDYIQSIGLVTASFLHLESAVKNSILTWHPGYPPKYLASAQIHNLLPILKEFEAKPIRNFITQAKDIRNTIIHNLYDKAELKPEGIAKLEIAYNNAFKPSFYPTLVKNRGDIQKLPVTYAYVWITMLGAINILKNNTTRAAFLKISATVNKLAIDNKKPKKEMYDLLATKEPAVTAIFSQHFPAWVEDLLKD
jgi:hypothetical protein